MRVKLNVAALGQVYTPQSVVAAMLALRRRFGTVLEPSCGNGAFLQALPDCTAIEVDPTQAPPGAWVGDFFAYPPEARFDTIIGNPPYVRYRDILPDTQARLSTKLFDRRSNLYLFFIEKAVRHLAPGGELIFITPRDFLKSTNATRLNRWLYQQGTITDYIELGDIRIFTGAIPNCAIWRFERGNTRRSTRYASVGYGQPLDQALANLNWEPRTFAETEGHLLFLRDEYPVRFRDIFFAKVGAVSGADEIYADPNQGTREFVCSTTVRTGETRRMIWSPEHPHPALLPHKERLLLRRVRPFDESNWWQWGRSYFESERPRIYVNTKTRNPRPFFLHPCPHYDGAVLALFPHDPEADVSTLCTLLNEVNWTELGFVCDGRHLFTQRSLERAPLPTEFADYCPGPLPSSQAQATTAENR